MSRQNGTASRRSSGRHPAGKRVNARRHLGRCPVSGKVRFRDKREALEAVHAAGTVRRFAEADGSTTTRQERRTYLCSRCHGWHLTSQELRDDVSPAHSHGPARSGMGDPIDKAAGPRRVFLAIRKLEVAEEVSIHSNIVFSDYPRRHPVWAHGCPKAPSQFGHDTWSSR